ncbi:MAG: hypothetical protein EPO06_11600 [Burkholderiaceae bacterium]|nr:MAG: hypothetical protein EPO06_11600 [Burkholderiaceae bacterium]
MTTIVALARGGHVWMGADELTNVYERPVLGAVKILRHPAGTSEVLLGFTGFAGLVAETATHLTITEPPQYAGEMLGWAHTIAAKVSRIAMGAHLTEDGQMAGRVLLGACGRLWTLTHMGAIAHLDGMGALGSGEGPAIGALDALTRYSAVDPAEAVTIAVQIGINRDRCSGGTPQVEHLPPCP